MGLERFKRIIILSLPIIGGMISQNLLNLVDTAMVGRLGAPALAAVGVASFAVFMSNAMVLGLSSGVQAVAARRVGEGRLDEAGLPLMSGILIAIILGVMITLFLYPFIPALFTFLNDDPEVSAMGSSYWRIRLYATVFMGIAYAFRGYFNGIGEPKYYMLSLVAIHILNVILNYVFIFGHFGAPAMGTDGAALASALATVAGSLFYFVISFYHLHHLKIYQFIPKLTDVSNVLKLMLPAGIQQLMIAASISSLFWVVGNLGVIEVAALNILVNILMLCMLPGFGFGMAAATLVGTNLGEKQYDKAKQWAYDVVKTGGLFTLVAGLLLAFFAENILYIFTNDAATIEAAIRPLRITGGIIFLDVVSVIMMNALLGAGDVKVVLKTSLIFQWFVFFPIGAILVLNFSPSFLTIWLVFSLSRIAQGGVYFIVWHLNRWGKVAL